MDKEKLHNMLDAVMDGNNEMGRLNFHDYLKDKFPGIVGHGKLAKEQSATSETTAGNDQSKE